MLLQVLYRLLHCRYAGCYALHVVHRCSDHQHVSIADFRVCSLQLVFRHALLVFCFSLTSLAQRHASQEARWHTVDLTPSSTFIKKRELSFGIQLPEVLYQVCDCRYTAVRFVHTSIFTFKYILSPGAQVKRESWTSVQPLVMRLACALDSAFAFEQANELVELLREISDVAGVAAVLQLKLRDPAKLVLAAHQLREGLIADVEAGKAVLRIDIERILALCRVRDDVRILAA